MGKRSSVLVVGIIKLRIASMVQFCEFKWIWADYMSRIVNNTRKKCSLLQFQSDVGLFKTVEDKSSVVDVFVRCLREVHCGVEINIGKLPLD